LRKDSESVTGELVRIFRPHKKHVKTITADNGKEFAGHEIVARKIKADYYFAHPYRSCERGLNENTNGLIRQYFPKGMDFRNVNRKELKTTMKKLNSRPRKTLGYKIPQEMFKLKKI
jgi:transposase, IS30 family